VPGARAMLLLVALGLLACSAELVEDFAQTWSAVYLRDVALLGAGLAGSGFVAVQGAQLLGRVAGDALVDRFGHVRVGRAGGLFVVAGAGAALVAPFVLDGPALFAVLLVGVVAAGGGLAAARRAARRARRDALHGRADGRRRRADRGAGRPVARTERPWEGRGMSSGRRHWVKRGSPRDAERLGPDFFRHEAAGLRWLAAARGGPRIVEVIEVDDDEVVLERIPDGRPTPGAADRLGRALSAMHDAGAPGWGSPAECWTGRC